MVSKIAAQRDPGSPGEEPSFENAEGLSKVPDQDATSTRLDSQSVGPTESYTLEHECGAGGCQQAAGDFLFHCHIGNHYIAGMWSFWRVFDTVQGDPVEALESAEETSGECGPPCRETS